MIPAHFRKLVFQSPCTISQVFRSSFVISFLVTKGSCCRGRKEEGTSNGSNKSSFETEQGLRGRPKILKELFCCDDGVICGVNWCGGGVYF